MTNLDQQSVPINTIRITESAANKINEFAKRDGKKKFGLRVAVKGGGCSGLQYVLEIVDSADDSDKIIDQNGIQVFIPKKAFVFLAGTVLDYSDGLNGKGFEFQNPNAKSTCGCGTSFAA